MPKIFINRRARCQYKSAGQRHFLWISKLTSPLPIGCSMPFCSTWGHISTTTPSANRRGCSNWPSHTTKWSVSCLPAGGSIITNCFTFKLTRRARCQYKSAGQRQNKMTYKNDPRKITVRFRCCCSKCLKIMAKGAFAYYWPASKTIMCPICGEPEYNRFRMAAADEDTYSGSANPCAY